MANCRPLPKSVSAQAALIKRTMVSGGTFGLMGLCVINYFLSPFDDMQRIYFMGWMGWAALIWSLWSWRYVFQELLCPNMIFLCVAYLFTFSQCLLLVFDLVPEHMNLLSNTAPQLYFKAQVFTLICLLFYHLGSIWGGCQSARAGLMPDAAVFKAVKTVALVLLVISVIPYCYITVWKIITVRIHGYGGLYDDSIAMGGTGNSQLNKIIGFAGSYCLPALLCLLVAYTRDVVKQMWLYAALAAIVLSIFFIGGRSDAAILIGLITLYRHYYVKPIKGGVRIFLFLASAFLVLSFLTVVGELRSQKDRSLMDYTHVFSEKMITENLVFSAISEMGGSMFPLVATMGLVPEKYPFRYGSTYLYDFLSVVPNFGIWDVHPAMENANLGDWLQKTLKLNYGPGYSLVAEAYINWGLFGFVFFVVQGFVFGRVFSLVSIKNAFSRPDIFCFCLIVLLFTIKTNRNSFLATVRAFSYAAVPILLLIRGIYYRGLERLISSKRTRHRVSIDRSAVEYNLKSSHE
jgi:oligosaccharide repeat unit polymerase